MAACARAQLHRLATNRQTVLERVGFLGTLKDTSHQRVLQSQAGIKTASHMDARPGWAKEMSVLAALHHLLGREEGGGGLDRMIYATNLGVVWWSGDVR